jgi:hypothetical protein
MIHLKKYVLLSCALLVVGIQPRAAEASYAQRLYARLAGIPLKPGSAKHTEVERLIREGKLLEAAALAVEEESFYSAVLRSWASQMLTVTESPSAQLNDAQAMVIGAVRDDLDARTLLTGDFTYGVDSRFGEGEARVDTPKGYLRLENSGRSIKRYLVKLTPQVAGLTDPLKLQDIAGILSTRGWGALYYSDGTNRRPVEGIFRAFLCTPIAGWKEEGLPQYRIRRDIDRNPGGNPETFQNLCSTCHSRMDGLAGAFGFVDYVQGRMLFSDRVASKFNQNGTVYPEGYVTDDNSWVNFVTPRTQDHFGWRGKKSGYGIRELGEMIAGSRKFSSCMAERTYRQICKKNSADAAGVIAELSAAFEHDQYRLKNLFMKTAVHPQCLGDPADEQRSL